MIPATGQARHHPRPSAAEPLQALGLLAGGLVLLLIYVASVGISRNWWSPVLGLRFRAASAAGLQPGLQVKISGIPVGRVRSLRIRPDAQVLVNLDVGESYRPLVGRRSRASLAQDSLLGNAYVAISPDPQADGGSRIGGGALIPYDAHPDLQTLLTTLAETRIPLQKALGASVGLTTRRIPASLDELDRTLRSSRRLAGSLERDLGSSSRALAGTALAVSGTALQLRQTSSAANRLLNQSNGMADQGGPLLLQTLQELRGIATTTNTLVQRLDRSVLLELLSPAQPANGPAVAPLPAAHPATPIPAGTAAAPAQERNRRE